MTITEGRVLTCFSYVKQSWDFCHFLEIVTSSLVRRSQYNLIGTFFHRKNIQLGENRFLQACKGAENTKEKSRAVLYASLRVKGLKNLNPKAYKERKETLTDLRQS